MWRAVRRLRWLLVSVVAVAALWTLTAGPPRPKAAVGGANFGNDVVVIHGPRPVWEIVVLVAMAVAVSALVVWIVSGVRDPRPKRVQEGPHT